MNYALVITAYPVTLAFYHKIVKKSRCCNRNRGSELATESTQPHAHCDLNAEVAALSEDAKHSAFEDHTTNETGEKLECDISYDMIEPSTPSAALTALTDNSYAGIEPTTPNPLTEKVADHTLYNDDHSEAVEACPADSGVAVQLCAVDDDDDHDEAVLLCSVDDDKAVQPRSADSGVAVQRDDDEAVQLSLAEVELQEDLSMVN